jgi:hypothetical protein
MVDGGLLAALGVRLPEDDIIDGGMFEYEGGSIKVPMAPGWASAWTGTSWTNTHSSIRSWEDILTTGTPETLAVTPSCPSSASRTRTSP